VQQNSLTGNRETMLGLLSVDASSITMISFFVGKAFMTEFKQFSIVLSELYTGITTESWCLDFARFAFFSIIILEVGVDPKQSVVFALSFFGKRGWSKVFCDMLSN